MVNFNFFLWSNIPFLKNRYWQTTGPSGPRCCLINPSAESKWPYDCLNSRVGLVRLHIYIEMSPLLWWWVNDLLILSMNQELVPLCWHGLDLIPAWISNYINYKVWTEIAYPFPNFNNATFEIWIWIRNYFTGHVITINACINVDLC